MKKLAEIATSQPHVLYVALTHGSQSKWTYLTRTVPNISNLLEPLEYALPQKLLPVLTGRDGITDTERELFALPINHIWRAGHCQSHQNCQCSVQ